MSWSFSWLVEISRCLVQLLEKIRSREESELMPILPEYLHAQFSFMQDIDVPARRIREIVDLAFAKAARILKWAPVGPSCGLKVIQLGTKHGSGCPIRYWATRTYRSEGKGWYYHCHLELLARRSGSRFGRDQLTSNRFAPASFQ
jgi:hypothetical protein